MSSAFTYRVFRPDPVSIWEPEQCGRARFAARRIPPSALLISAAGEIDATNGRNLARYVERHAAVSTQMVLDLSALEFFGTQGFAALHNVNVGCTQNGVAWVIVGGRDVRRLIRICDPDGVLPVADGVTSALEALDRRRQDNGYPRLAAT